MRPKMTLRFLALLLILSGCATGDLVEDFPLMDRVLRPREGHALTWKRCQKNDFWGRCEFYYDIVVYDVNNDSVRENLDSLKFVCKINEIRYHLCKEGNKAGFCNQTFKRDWFLGPKKRILLDFIEASDFERLVDGKARCFSTRSYGFFDV